MVSFGCFSLRIECLVLRRAPACWASRLRQKGTGVLGGALVLRGKEVLRGTGTLESTGILKGTEMLIGIEVQIH